MFGEVMIGTKLFTRCMVCRQKTLLAQKKVADARMRIGQERRPPNDAVAADAADGEDLVAASNAIDVAVRAIVGDATFVQAQCDPEATIHPDKYRGPACNKHARTVHGRELLGLPEAPPRAPGAAPAEDEPPEAEFTKEMAAELRKKYNQQVSILAQIHAAAATTRRQAAYPLARPREGLETLAFWMARKFVSFASLDDVFFRDLHKDAIGSTTRQSISIFCRARAPQLLNEVIGYKFACTGATKRFMSLAIDSGTVWRRYLVIVAHVAAQRSLIVSLKPDIIVDQAAGEARKMLNARIARARAPAPAAGAGAGAGAGAAAAAAAGAGANQAPDDGVDEVTVDDATPRLTIDNLVEHVRALVLRLESRGCVVIGISTDNASNMRGMSAKLRLFDSRCLAHGIQLLVRVFMLEDKPESGDDDDIDAADRGPCAKIAMAVALLGAVVDSVGKLPPARRDELGLCGVRKPVETRWNDTLYMMRQVIAKVQPLAAQLVQLEKRHFPVVSNKLEQFHCFAEAEKNVRLEASKMCAVSLRENKKRDTCCGGTLASLLRRPKPSRTAGDDANHVLRRHTVHREEENGCCCSAFVNRNARRVRKTHRRCDNASATRASS